MSSRDLSTVADGIETIQVKTISSRSFQACLLRIRMFLGSRVFYRKSVEAYTMRLDRNTHLKLSGRAILETEANNIHFISTHTTIPVPKIRQLLCIDGRRYLVMDHAKGKPLYEYWDDMSESIQEKVVDQLRDYVSQLRALIPPQPEVVASISGGPIWEPARLGTPLLGPFTTHADFHDCLRAGIPLSEFRHPKLPWMEPIFRAHSLKYETKCTHGDLAGRNIICKADGTITCILDWETAGWYPEYWEYTKAHYFPSNGEDWTKRIGLITGDYPEQLLAETYARAYVEPLIEPYLYEKS